jgi:hypothetical protein
MAADSRWDIDLDNFPLLHDGHPVCKKEGLRQIVAYIFDFWELGTFSSFKV